MIMLIGKRIFGKIMGLNMVYGNANMKRETYAVEQEN